jgi:hypothetical protein
VSPPPDVKTSRDLAQWYANRSDAVFRGKVKTIELKWVLMEAKVGGLVSADLEQDEPTLLVTFDVSTSYKGPKKTDVHLTTGVGGGDCGFDFEIDRQYLVYAFADASDQLSTGICSGTRLLEQSQSDLSYLRGEQAVPERVKENANLPATKFCGHISSTGTALADSQVFLLRVGNRSPIPSEEAGVAQDGSFCIVGVKPGNYYLAFMSRAEDAPTSFVFFPGVTNSSAASTVEVKSGQVRSDLTLDVSSQPTFSVSGNVHIPNKSSMPAESKVFLISADPLSFLVGYSKEVNPSGSFESSRVLAGKYWAFVGVESDSAPHWLTRKSEVQVDATISGLSLELIHK